MLTYVYIVKCPECEDEYFDFFDEAKDFAQGCLSKKPIITQTEVNRNDFGECTDSADLGTIWSWEDMMKDVEPEDTKFSKAETFGISEGLDDFDDFDIGPQSDEFETFDNSLDFDFEEEEVTEEPVTEDAVPRHRIVGATRAPKESEYVIVFKHPRSGKHYLFGRQFTITNDINKAMTYPGKFSAEDEIKYAEDAADNYGFTFEVKIDTYQDDTYYDDYRSVNFFVTTVAEARKLPGVIDKTTSQDSLRKPIPEGMTIEQLVEEMEENEDTVECTWCNDLFDKSECRREVDLGWLCSRCEMAIKSRGETLTFREGNYWDFLDEDLTEELSFEDLVKDSINHLTNALGKDPCADDFTDDVIADIENNYDVYIPEDPIKYRDWASAIACEVSRQVNNQEHLTEASLSDIAAAANSEFGTSWDDDYLLDVAGIDDDFRSIDSFGDTLPKNKKSRELSPEAIAKREAKAAEHERQKNLRFAQRYIAKYGSERYNSQYPVGRQNWHQEWPYYDEATGEFVEGERRDALVKKFEDEQHAKRVAEYEERHNQPHWYIQTRYNGKWHTLMNTTATTKEDAENWALDYMKNLEAEKRAAGSRFDWKETDIRVVAGKGPGPGSLQRFA